MSVIVMSSHRCISKFFKLYYLLNLIIFDRKRGSLVIFISGIIFLVASLFSLLFPNNFSPIFRPVEIAAVVAGPPGIIGARNGNTVFAIGATLLNTFFTPPHMFPKKSPIFLKNPTAIFKDFLVLRLLVLTKC
jgi:hypothetical protein